MENNNQLLESKIPYFFYYSILQELQDNNLRINNLKGFSFQSMDESILWSSELNRVSSKISNALYAAIEEVRFINRDYQMQQDNEESVDYYSKLAIRATIIGYILEYSEVTMVLKEIEKINSDLYDLFSECIRMSTVFSSEFNIDDYGILVRSLHGSSDIFTKSIFLKTLSNNGEKIFRYIQSIVKAGALDKFFSPFFYAKKSLVGIIKEKGEKDILEILIFKEHFLWFGSTGESSFLSYIFIPEGEKNKVLILESLRLLLKSTKYATSNTRNQIFKEAFASFVFLCNTDEANKELEEAILKSQNIVTLRNKFWIENNKRKLSEMAYSINNIIKDVFADFKRNIAEKGQQESYYLLFSNIHNAIKNRLLEENVLYPVSSIEDKDIESIASILHELIIEIILEKKGQL